MSQCWDFIAREDYFSAYTIWPKNIDTWPSHLQQPEKYFYKILEHICGNLCAFSQKSISEVRQWCWMRSPSLDLTFQFILKVFSAVKVMALWRPLEFFHTKHIKSCLYGPWLCSHGGTGKVAARPWKHISWSSWCTGLVLMLLPEPFWNCSEWCNRG